MSTKKPHPGGVLYVPPVPAAWEALPGRVHKSDEEPQAPSPADRRPLRIGIRSTLSNSYQIHRSIR